MKIKTKQKFKIKFNFYRLHKIQDNIDDNYKFMHDRYKTQYKTIKEIEALIQLLYHIVNFFQINLILFTKFIEIYAESIPHIECKYILLCINYRDLY